MINLTPGQSRRRQLKQEVAWLPPDFSGTTFYE